MDRCTNAVKLELYFRSGHHLPVSKNTELVDLVESAIELDPKMRFMAVLDRRGGILEAIMKEGKASLKSQREEEYFCRQVAQRRRMRREFDGSLGSVSYVHVEREKVTQMVFYTPRHTVYFTMEPEMAIRDKIRIVNRIKKMTAHL